MMDSLCRFCGLDFADTTKYLIDKSETILRYYRSLPSEVQVDDSMLPKTCCNACNTKICESVKFYDSVLIADRNLKRMLKISRRKINEASPPSKQIRLRRLSELVDNKSELKIPERPVETVSVSEIYDKLKAKSSITISKLVDPESNKKHVEDGIEGMEKDIKSAIQPERSSNLLSHIASAVLEVEKGERSIPYIVKNSGSPSPNFICGQCKYKFKSLVAFQRHKEMNDACNGTNVICEQCNKAFRNRRAYVKHVHELHANEVSLVGKCINCEEIFPSCELQAHQETCNGKLCVCETCGKTYKSKKVYTKHIREHLKVPPYKCGKCNLRFRKTSLLKKHQCCKNNPYFCDTCGKMFSELSSLLFHKRLHTNEM